MKVDLVSRILEAYEGKHKMLKRIATLETQMIEVRGELVKHVVKISNLSSVTLNAKPVEKKELRPRRWSDFKNAVEQGEAVDAKGQQR